MAADHLASRYREKGQFLQAWGNVGEAKEYRMIIDCLLNLPILYWASEVTGDGHYAQMAENHIKTAMKCILRPEILPIILILLIWKPESRLTV